MQGEAQTTAPLAHLLAEQGFALVPNLLTQSELAVLREALGPIQGTGRRGLLAEPAIADLLRTDVISKVVRFYAGEEARPVKALYFDKTPEVNWAVSWHQDQMIAVRERFELPGFGPWTKKEDILQVQPPVDVLEKMLTMRIHLDDCDENNGALKMLPGTHRLGRIDSTLIDTLSRELDPIVCRCPAGAALLMRPLLLHSSSRASRPGHRRVLHVEYAGFPLPSPLEWHDSA